MTRKILLVPPLEYKHGSDVKSQQAALSQAGYRVAILHDRGKAKSILNDINTVPMDYDAILVSSGDVEGAPASSKPSGPLVINVDKLLPHNVSSISAKLLQGKGGTHCHAAACCNRWIMVRCQRSSSTF